MSDIHWAWIIAGVLLIFWQHLQIELLDERLSKLESTYVPAAPEEKKP